MKMNVKTIREMLLLRRYRLPLLALLVLGICIIPLIIYDLGEPVVTLYPPPEVFTTGNAPRVLCLVLTTSASKSKMAALNGTWLRRCDKHLFLIGDPVFGKVLSGPDILNINLKESRNHLTGKVRRAFQHVYDRYKDSFDWILKCDDDSYFIMENLRHLVSKIAPGQPSYLGFHMKLHVRNGYKNYMSGAGYILSSRGLRDLVEIGFKSDKCKQDGGDEDVEIGTCIQNSGVPVLHSLDVLGKETFHAEPLGEYLYPPHARWLLKYGFNDVKFGADCCSKYSISFHHLTEREIYLYEHLLYYTAVYGQTQRTDSHVIFRPFVV